jgi:hypothetical protein
MKRWMWYPLFVALGIAAGWAYWNWYGCTNGCTITGQWWSSMAYGGVMGYLVLGLVLPARKAEAGATPQRDMDTNV